MDNTLWENTTPEKVILRNGVVVNKSTLKMVQEAFIEIFVEDKFAALDILTWIRMDDAFTYRSNNTKIEMQLNKLRWKNWVFSDEILACLHAITWSINSDYIKTIIIVDPINWENTTLEEERKKFRNRTNTTLSTRISNPKGIGYGFSPCSYMSAEDQKLKHIYSINNETLEEFIKRCEEIRNWSKDSFVWIYNQRNWKLF